MCSYFYKIKNYKNISFYKKKVIPIEVYPRIKEGSLLKKE
jgi:hypothetical protein